VADPARITLLIETKTKWSIPNEVRLERPAVALDASRELFKQIHPRAHLRSLTAVYNCIGLVVACRRCWVDTEHLSRVFTGDGFTRVESQAEVQLGDVVVYRDDEGEVSHAGIVAMKRLFNPEEPSDVLVVVSKWGADGEYEHDVTDVPKLLGAPAEHWTDRKG
jgi:hypothetical protein